MQLAHLGVAVFIIGVTLVKGYEVERDVRMDIGDSVTVGNYSFKFEARRSAGPELQGRARHGRGDEERQVHRAPLSEKRIYNVQQMPMTESGDRLERARRHLCLARRAVANGAWSVRVYSKPFVTWIWAVAC